MSPFGHLLRLVFFISLILQGGEVFGHHSRSLTFPPSPTLIKFVCGFGVPVTDLYDYEAVTSGVVLKAVYRLPREPSDWYRHELRPLNIHQRSFNVSEPAQMYRWILYKGVETLIDRAGLPGHICLLRSICEHAAAPFHYQSGLLAEILNIILTPSSSKEPMSLPSQEDYFRAERVGHWGGISECSLVFEACPRTPMHLMSVVLNQFGQQNVE